MISGAGINGTTAVSEVVVIAVDDTEGDGWEDDEDGAEEALTGTTRALRILSFSVFIYEIYSSIVSSLKLSIMLMIIFPSSKLETLSRKSSCLLLQILVYSDISSGATTV